VHRLLGFALAFIDEHISIDVVGQRQSWRKVWRAGRALGSTRQTENQGNANRELTR
jgi:hypothetical protein